MIGHCYHDPIRHAGGIPDNPRRFSIGFTIGEPETRTSISPVDWTLTFALNWDGDNMGRFRNITINIPWVQLFEIIHLILRNFSIAKWRVSG
jgi:hypothetical protein